MTIQFELPPELESKIQHHAQLAGMDVNRFVLALVRAGLLFTETVEAAAEEPTISPEEQAARLREWVRRFPRRGDSHVDDSRESIYEDRV